MKRYHSDMSKKSTLALGPIDLGWVIAAMLGLTIAISGCAHSTYYASDLPAEFQAPASASRGVVNLAQFAKPITTTDVVEPGDVIQVSISTGLEQRYAPRWDLRVDEQGMVTVPIVGSVQIGGLPLTEADRVIYDAAVSRGFYRHPNVAVTRIDRRESRIVVAGAVKRPGSYDLPASSCDVLTALVAAGGLDPKADTVVEVRQPNPTQPAQMARGREQFASYDQGDAAHREQTIHLDLSQPEQINDWDVMLNDGAVITVQQRPEEVVAVMGKVKKPGQFELPDGADMRFLDAIALAGGQTVSLADKAYVVRQSSDDAEPVLIRVSIRDAKSDPAANIRLAPGDVVSIEETPLTVGVETLTKMIRFGLSSRVIF